MPRPSGVPRCSHSAAMERASGRDAGAGSVAVRGNLVVREKSEGGEEIKQKAGGGRPPRGDPGRQPKSGLSEAKQGRAASENPITQTPGGRAGRRASERRIQRERPAVAAAASRVANAKKSRRLSEVPETGAWLPRVLNCRAAPHRWRPSSSSIRVQSRTRRSTQNQATARRKIPQTEDRRTGSRRDRSLRRGRTRKGTPRGSGSMAIRVIKNTGHGEPGQRPSGGLLAGHDKGPPPK